jgi:hypothetical protein
MRNKVGTGWATPGDRVRWLLADRYSGSRSAMAKATGVSLTGLIKIVTGQQTPGRRLLEKIAQNTAVNPAWLYAGEGPPFKGSAIPVAVGCLSGPPREGDPLLTGERVPEVAALYSPTRYWLKVRAAAPPVRSGGSALLGDDLMLMETDRAEFPAAKQLDGRWAAVRVAGRGGPHVRLAQLTFVPEGDDNHAYLDADTFDTHPMRVQRVTIDIFPDGSWEAAGTRQLAQPRGKDETKPDGEPWAAAILGHEVGLEDVVAVCVLVVRLFQ